MLCFDFCRDRHVTHQRHRNQYCFGVPIHINYAHKCSQLIVVTASGNDNLYSDDVVTFITRCCHTLASIEDVWWTWKKTESWYSILILLLSLAISFSLLHSALFRFGFSLVWKIYHLLRLSAIVVCICERIKLYRMDANQRASNKREHVCLLMRTTRAAPRYFGISFVFCFLENLQLTHDSKQHKMWETKRNEIDK